MSGPWREDAASRQADCEACEPLRTTRDGWEEASTGQLNHQPAGAGELGGKPFPNKVNILNMLSFSHRNLRHTPLSK